MVKKRPVHFGKLDGNVFETRGQIIMKIVTMVIVGAQPYAQIAKHGRSYLRILRVKNLIMSIANCALDGAGGYEKVYGITSDGKRFKNLFPSRSLFQNQDLM